MNIKTPDKSLLHLYPPFRTRLERVFAEAKALFRAEWMIAEGYRSQERQTYLWQQGRERPGPVVTWKRTPEWHGSGLAADCLPKSRGYSAPRDWWERFRGIYLRHGFDNPAWTKNDLGHLQLSDPVLRARALAWVRAGFKDPTPDPRPEVSVVVDGEPVPDADAYLEAGRAWVKLRPVTDGLDLVIAEVAGGAARIVDDRLDVWVPIVRRSGRAFAKASDLPAKVLWLPGEKIVSLARKG